MYRYSMSQENTQKSSSDIKRAENQIAENLENLTKGGKKLKATRQQFKDTMERLDMIFGDEDSCNICGHSLNWHHVMENGKVMEYTNHNPVPKIEVGINLDALDSFFEYEEDEPSAPDFLYKYRMILYGKVLHIQKETISDSGYENTEVATLENSLNEFGKEIAEKMILTNAIPKFLIELKEQLEKTNKRSEKIATIAAKLDNLMRGL